MLIPSIDLRGGRVVQLVQGQRQALAFDDVFEWVERFAQYPRVQLIDLDAAMGAGDNRSLVADICRRLPCRVGGGLRTPEAAALALEAGAREVIVGSALFTAGGTDAAFAASLAAACGASRVIAAVDALGGRVAVKGWKETLAISPADAARQLEPWCGGVLYTHIDTEGLMGGIDMEAVRKRARRHVAPPLGRRRDHHMGRDQRPRRDGHRRGGRDGGLHGDARVSVRDSSWGSGLG